mmetsp:Transcript_60994/g.125746  ORF Transcript_60994/g.125746 Transcript_60994/m.125746 type:complete len:228 (+) Transcript_60994:452-1135(+)
MTAQAVQQMSERAGDWFGTVSQDARARHVQEERFSIPRHGRDTEFDVRASLGSPCKPLHVRVARFGHKGTHHCFHSRHLQSLRPRNEALSEVAIVALRALRSRIRSLPRRIRRVGISISSCGSASLGILVSCASGVPEVIVGLSPGPTPSSLQFDPLTDNFKLKAGFKVVGEAFHRKESALNRVDDLVESLRYVSHARSLSRLQHRDQFSDEVRGRLLIQIFEIIHQ